MKRMILCSTDVIPPYFQDIAVESEYVGYNMQYDAKSESITLVARDSAQYMPKLDVKVSKDSSNVYTIDIKMNFPILDTSKLPYWDSVIYWMEKWSKIGTFVSNVTSKEYDPSQYEDI